MEIFSLRFQQLRQLKVKKMLAIKEYDWISNSELELESNFGTKISENPKTQFFQK